MKTHQQITLHFYWTVLIYCVVTNIRQKNYKWKSIQISVSRWQNDWNCRECKTSTASASLETNFWPCFKLWTIHTGANCIQLGVPMGGSQTFSNLQQPINTDCHSSWHALCRCTWTSTTRLSNLVTIISNVAIAPLYFQVALPRKTLARWEARECTHHKFEISIQNWLVTTRATTEGRWQ